MVIINVPLFSYFGNKDNEMDIIKDNITDINNINTRCGNYV